MFNLDLVRKISDLIDSHTLFVLTNNSMAFFKSTQIGHKRSRAIHFIGLIVWP